MLGSSLLTVIECSRNSKLSETVGPWEQVPAPLPDLHMAQASERAHECRCVVSDALQCSGLADGPRLWKKLPQGS